MRRNDSILVLHDRRTVERISRLERIANISTPQQRGGAVAPCVAPVPVP
jgi:hypothetical protein